MNCSARGASIYRENDATIQKVRLLETNPTVTAHEHALIKAAAEGEEKARRSNGSGNCRGREGRSRDSP